MTSKIYSVKSVPDHSMMITGAGDHPHWSMADRLESFIYPWDEGSPPPMTFKALHDRDWLYGNYIVKDRKKIISQVDQNNKFDVLASDRVEIFFRKDRVMTPYYGLELDSLGRIYDYQAIYHRNFKPEWSWPEKQLVVKTHPLENGYILEFAISKNSLKDLGLLSGNKIEAGLYRGECISLYDKQAEFKWISWIDPGTPTPDFHVPDSFGELILESK